MEDLELQIGEQKLKGRIYKPIPLKDKNPAILFVYGWTGEMNRSFQYSESLVKLGYVCFHFDFTGHGFSVGNRNTLTLRDLLHQAIKVYDYLVNIPYVDSKSISLVGSSLGGYLAAIMTSQRKVKNLVLRAPADYPDTIFDELKSKNTGDSVIPWRRHKRDYSESMSLRAVHDFDGNILMIESELDNKIPHTTIENFMNAVRNKKKLTHVLMPGAPHSIMAGPFRDQVEKILIDWFS